MNDSEHESIAIYRMRDHFEFGNQLHVRKGSTDKFFAASFKGNKFISDLT